MSPDIVKFEKHLERPLKKNDLLVNRQDLPFEVVDANVEYQVSDTNGTPTTCRAVRCRVLTSYGKTSDVEDIPIASDRWNHVIKRQHRTDIPFYRRLYYKIADRSSAKNNSQNGNGKS